MNDLLEMMSAKKGLSPVIKKKKLVQRRWSSDKMSRRPLI